MDEQKIEPHLVTIADGVHAWIGAGRAPAQKHRSALKN
jgi:hypothetical protein